MIRPPKEIFREMTDEDGHNNPMDDIEAMHGLKNLATGAWAFYAQLVEEGFDRPDALKLTAAWIGGLAGGKVA